MKINLLLDNPGDVRSGYINIDPYAQIGDEARFHGNVGNLDEVVDNNEAKEIIALDILDYFSARDADTVLSNWLSKLSHGGKLTISAVDIKEVSKAILAGTITHDESNELLHGKQEKDWQFKKTLYTISHLVEVLKNRGYKILSKKIQNFRAIITVERP